jgi:hypothetical protein
LFKIEKVRASPFASDAVGRKLYREPIVVVRDGEPLIVGALLVVVELDTVMLKALKEVVALPSLTLMMMLLWVPVALGVPAKVPVEVEKVAQLGLFWTLKPTESPFTSFATGRKLYATPTLAVVGGVPAIAGALLVVVVLVLTLIVKAGKLTVLLPSVVLITMLEYVATCELLGVPLKRPVLLLKLAQLGLFEIEKISGSPLESLATG